MLIVIMGKETSNEERIKAAPQTYHPGICANYTTVLKLQVFTLPVKTIFTQKSQQDGLFRLQYWDGGFWKIMISACMVPLRTS